MTSTGRVCGGYTYVSWSKSLGYKSDRSAVVFSVDNKVKYPCLKYGQAVYHRDRGPSFGGYLLEIMGSPMNKENGSNCYTDYSDLARYNVDLSSSGCSILTGQKDKFTCAEMEVYKVTFEMNSHFF